MQTMTRKRFQKNDNPYLNQKIMSASPNQLISYVFDAGIAACGRQDRSKATQAVNTLIKALNFDYKEIATTFFNMYRFINRLVVQGRFEEARNILVDLKQTWNTAMNVT